MPSESEPRPMRPSLTDTRLKTPKLSKGGPPTVKEKNSDSSSILSSQADRRMSRAYDTRRASMGFHNFVILKRRFSTFKETIAGRRRVQVENTYKMEPDKEHRFQSSEAEQVVFRSLKFFMDDLKYQPKACARLTKAITEDIKRKVRDRMKLTRHKIICHVTIAENTGQTCQAVSRSLWDAKNDSFATASYKTPFMLGMATVYAVYYE